MSPEKLVYMANQIGKFFANQGEEKAALAVADHITKYWEPRMRSAIIAHLQSGGGGLNPSVARAVGMVAAATSRESTLI
jgi:formate dehydrogenase subunit delta